MTRLSQLIGFSIAISITGKVLAGQLYGTIRSNSGPTADYEVQVFCPDADDLPDQPTYTARTDRFGSYSIYVAETGTCALKLPNTRKVTVPVYDDDVRYDFRVNGSELLRH